MHVPCPENTSAISELPQTICEDIVVALQQRQPVNYAMLCHVLGSLLRELKIYEDILDTHDRLSHVITLCPHLRRVWLVFANEFQIEPLARLAFLEDLTIIILNRDFSLDFSDLIQQLLRCVGWRLKRLRLNAPVLSLTSLVR
ncbi:hypothetical protein HPB47_022941 [Ixodes persulcatus]|uniref:Uncharacterized protein n=1 Tax=Ixodes persulcatus TaxID=34615 RepID=A0AC60Q8E1_IXOPE|nr:hypothetical protein HPB47_022941 [Ixodes persulcatus]